ncbi:ammonium transporter [Aliagarivorans taiwanensis]|uniref:ammonium transporter n=1 Tax=Aliagarivorans taiwanensis TaxID=561966 RepID=UPI00041BE7EF|nr:ammonium transporter [Aliagarivorans taiwanensis]
MDSAWLLGTAALVFLMQAGFLCLESGKIRSKNSINVAAKNISDFIIASALFWLFGFGLMFGDSLHGWLGSSEFLFGEHNSPEQISFFLFQVMFCGTAATLMSGAVAERMSYHGYLLAAVVLSAVIYPVSGHWAWAGLYSGEAQGWLERQGFVDFAGSTVVHSVGGWVALAAILIIGPRIGRFDSEHAMPMGSNLPLSVLGTLLLWLGWFGFNGGSTLAFTDAVPKILLNTCLAAAWSGIVCSACHFLRKGFIDVSYILNGVIAGLVAITACCHVVSGAAAAFIGMVAGLVVYWGTWWLARCRIDDALAVVPAHLFAGIWGTLALALFADLEVLGTGLSRAQQLGVQLQGIACIGLYAFGLSYLLLRLIDIWLPLRVSRADEISGMNVSEHRASTELIDLLDSMQQQQREGTFSEPVPVEPFTEVGQIAKRYNQVIARVNAEINKRDHAITSFRSSERRKSAILDSSMDCIVSIDLQGRILEFNPASERCFGYLKRQVTGKSFIELFIEEDKRAEISESLSHGFSTSQGLLRNRRNNMLLSRSSGDRFPAEITITGAGLGASVRDEFTLHIRDVTRQQKMQSRLKNLAYSDALTGLANRTYLIQQLNKMLHLAGGRDLDAALLFLDLDHFKKINDTLGHKAGDHLLVEVSKRLSTVCRNSDIVARWGGDEFIILLKHVTGAEQARFKAEEVLQALRLPLEIEGRQLNVPSSIGVVFCDSAYSSAEQLVQYADIAMYQAKQLGRDNYQLFQPEMATQAAREFDYEQALRKGLEEEQQLSLVYQPKVTQQGQLVGLEALLRWQHPTEGMISPVVFIPLAEESDLIIGLGEWVVERTLKQLDQWRSEGNQLVPVSVNISGKHLRSVGLVPFIRQRLAHYQLPGELLEIELTEGVLLTDIERCIEVMTELKALKLKISIDDFGTGYSSLNYLKRLPIDVLKIDRSFVDECANTHEDGQICATIISLAKNLELTTVAEGVENQQQLTFLASRGCDVYQGFWFYKPESAEWIAQLLAEPAQTEAGPAYTPVRPSVS